MSVYGSSYSHWSKTLGFVKSLVDDIKSNTENESTQTDGNTFSFEIDGKRYVFTVKWHIYSNFNEKKVLFLFLVRHLINL